MIADARVFCPPIPPGSNWEQQEALACSVTERARAGEPVSLPEEEAALIFYLHKNPTDAAVSNSLLSCLLRQGKLEEAIEKLKMAFSLISERDPKYRGPAILTNTGLVFSRLKQPDSAIYYYERSIALDPTFSTAWYNLSIQRLFKGDTTRCFELLERSLVAGFNPNYIASDSDFAGLLEDPRMKQLLKKYEY